MVIALAVVGFWMGAFGVVKCLKHESHASSLYGWDTSFYYFWLRSVVLDGDVDFENDIQLADTIPDDQKLFAQDHLRRTEKGLVPNKYPVGWAVFHLPWFLMGHGSSLLLEKMGADVRTDGFGKVYERFMYVGSLCYAALALWLTYLLMRRFFDWEVSLLGLLCAWLSGMLIYYQLNQYGMAHSLTYLCLVSCFYWCFAIRDRPQLERNWLWLGLSVGLLLITRYQAGVYLLFPFVVAVVEILARRTTARAVAVCVLAMNGVVFLQLLAWKLLYGSWLVYSYTGEGFRWGDPEIAKSLFDPFHGLFYWHPIFLVGLCGLLGFVVSRRDRLAWFIPVSVLGMIYVNAAWGTWWFGAAFGGRAYEGVTLFVCLGVGWLLQRSRTWNVGLQWGLKVLLLVLVVWNLGVLDVSVMNWKTGINLEEPIRYGQFWQAIRELWF